jgi:hypothetical protein
LYSCKSYRRFAKLSRVPMKKTILNITLVLALGVMFASCEKEDIQPNTATTVDVDDLLKDGDEILDDGKGDDGGGGISDHGSEEGGDSQAGNSNTNRPG